MPSISVTVNGSGRVVVLPSNNVEPRTLVSITAYPYEGESIQMMDFYDDQWSPIIVTQVSENQWKLRMPDYNIHVVATFTEHSPIPPDPPEPPVPPPVSIEPWMLAVLHRKKIKRRLKDE